MNLYLDTVNILSGGLDFLTELPHIAHKIKEIDKL